MKGKYCKKMDSYVALDWDECSECDKIPCLHIKQKEKEENNFTFLNYGGKIKV